MANPAPDCLHTYSRKPVFPGWPRGLRSDLAALYVGLSTTTFRKEVAAGRAPQPIHLTEGRLVWLRDQLDSWLDRMGGGALPSEEHNPWLE